jgi:glycosyltransferase involved in cell wall biosynthesis
MNLADARYFHSPPMPAAYTGDEVRLIYHGSVTPRYGLDVLVQALARARTEMPNAHLTIQGHGDYLQDIRALVRSLQIETLVSIDDQFLSAAELARLIAAHHIGVIPYRRDIFTDGILPTKLMEYLALGLAVIAARTPAITAYCDETMIELFEPANIDDLAQCLVRLYQQPARRRELAHQTIRFNQTYNWANQREQYVALVEMLGKSHQTQWGDVAVK